MERFPKDVWGRKILKNLLKTNGRPFSPADLWRKLRRVFLTMVLIMDDYFRTKLDGQPFGWLGVVGEWGWIFKRAFIPGQWAKGGFPLKD